MRRFQTFLPDPNNRHGFIWCNRGQPIPGVCDDGDIFNPIDRVCEVDDDWWGPPDRDVCFGLPDGVIITICD